MFFTKINAPYAGLTIVGGKPGSVLGPGFHIVMPFITSIRRISTQLRTDEVDIDVITRGGTPTSIKVGYTARVVDVKAAIINVGDPFATLRASVISVVSGAANSYTIDQLAQNKNDISEAAEQELAGLSKKHGWGLGDFQVAVGDPSMSEELKKLLMREEAVKRETAANLEKARNQVQIARQLVAVAKEMEDQPFARELLRLQVLADMGAGGKVIVIDSHATSVRDPDTVRQVLTQAPDIVAPTPPPRPPATPG
ncbi:MAG: SPFH domain-containing protein [Alphaproteobacteria bacterium]|nr:SPFH domain-containing protein [Alphaproteobacteria bacterium]